MKKRKLNYHIHDPNQAAATADYILTIFLEANAEKVETAIQTAACCQEEKDHKGHSA